MRQTELHLTKEDRELIESYRAKGLRHAREVNRAHILSALDRGIPEAQIMEVIGVGRTAIWRTRSAYLDGGVEYALCDVARSGKPREYDPTLRRRLPPWPARNLQKVPSAGHWNCWNRRHRSRRMWAQSAARRFAVC